MSSVEQREFAQFCKHFTIRAVQVIVQSRHGRKMRTASRITTQRRDWFSLNIDEIPEINQQLNQSLNGVYLPIVDSVNVLISLRTSEGETLHLEIWRVSLDSEQISDNAANLRTQLYHRISILLRSIIAASRTTPAYKLYARRQGAESFVLCYEISSGSTTQPQSLLGDGFKTTELGYVVSPFGSLKITLYYRTKMVISNDSPEKSSIQVADENYYDKNYDSNSKRRNSTEISSATAATTADDPSTYSSSLPRHHKCSPYHQQPILREIGPWQPLAEPSPSKVSPMPDFSPCFSTFSTSPCSADFNPYSPLLGRKPSVAFQVGATSGSSSEEGGSSHHLPSSSAIVRYDLGQSGGAEPTTPKRNSSSGIFRLELSEGGSTAPKPSSVPDSFGRGRPSSIVRYDSFPFSRLLSSCSAPAFSSTSALSVVGATGHRGSQLVMITRSPKRTVIEEEQSGPEANLEDSREITTTDGVKIYEKRKKNGSKKSKNAVGGDRHHHNLSDGEDSSSSDDSFVRIEMRPVFAAANQMAAGDASAFLSQCKLAPAQLKSFQIAERVVEEENVDDSSASASTTVRKPSIEEIPCQLKEFEEKQKLFDDFVKSLLNQRVEEVSSEGENDET